MYISKFLKKKEMLVKYSLTSESFLPANSFFSSASIFIRITTFLVLELVVSDEKNQEMGANDISENSLMYTVV